MELVNFRLLTSSQLVFNCLSLPHKVSPSTAQKNTSHPFLLACLVGAETYLFPVVPTPVQILNPQNFFKSFSVTTSALGRLFGNCLLYLFIYLFIQFQFSMSPFNYLTTGCFTPSTKTSPRPTTTKCIPNTHASICRKLPTWKTKLSS